MAKNKFLGRFLKKTTDENLEKLEPEVTEELAEAKESDPKPWQKVKEIMPKDEAGEPVPVKHHVWDKSAEFIVFLDEICDEFAEIMMDGPDEFLNFCAGVVDGVDRVADLVTWAVAGTFIRAGRRLHDLRIDIGTYNRDFIKAGSYFLATGVGIIVLFVTSTGYEYSYNGRALGIVEEQRDVLEILDMVSEELSQDYGSNIVINPETDITFRQVISYGKDVDNIDTVLKRFTYMGDIQAQAYALVVDGETIATLESEKIAEDILQDILDNYTANKDAEYEYVGFAEEIEIKAINTTLANVSSKSAVSKKLKSGGQQELTYTVEAGDTLYGICEKLGVSLKELKEMNPKISDTMVLHVGDKFVTQQEVPLLTVETVEVSTFAESVDFDTITKESGSYYKGETIVTRAGVKGKARVTARLTKHNGKTVEREDLETTIIQEPVSKIVVKGTKPVPPTGGTGQFQRPTSLALYRGYGMRWGRLHEGQDYSGPTGTAIRAADGGVVIAAGWSGAYGLRVIIDHQNGFQTRYAHNSANYVSVGDKVYKGQKIAAVGNTGRSTGPHLHFEIRKNGVAVNPAYYL